MYDIPFISMTAINRELPTSTLNNVIEVTNPDVDVKANDVEISTFRPRTGRRSENVDELTTGSASD